MGLSQTKLNITSYIKTTLSIFLICIISRLVLLGIILVNNQGDTSGLFYKDGTRYYDSARQLLEKNTYDAPHKKMTLWDTLGYPLVLSFFFKIFGPNKFLPIILNILFFSFSAGILYLVSAYLFDNKVALYSALIYSFHPTSFCISILPLPEPLFLCMFLLGVYFFVKFLTKAKSHNLASASIFMGLATLTKETTLFIPLAMIIPVLLKSKGTRIQPLRAIFSLILVYMIVLSPSIIYNYKVSGKYSISPKMDGYFSSLKGRLITPFEDIKNDNAKRSGLTVKKINYFLWVENYFRERRSFFWGTGTIPLLQAFGYDISNYKTTPEKPMGVLMFLRKMGWGWVVFQLIAWLFIGFIYFTSFLSLCYILINKHYLEAAFFILFIFYFIIAYLYYYNNSRYFFPIIAFLAPLSAYCIRIKGSKN